MLFRIEVTGSSEGGIIDNRPLDVYFVEAENINEASKKAQRHAEKEYSGEKPITVTKIETVSYDEVVR